MTERRQHATRTMALGVLALVAMLLAPFATTAKQESTGGTLVGAFDVGPGGARSSSTRLTAGAGFTWFEKYFSKLMLYNIDFSQIQGELAESWEINADATQYTIILREGVQLARRRAIHLGRREVHDRAGRASGQRQLHRRQVRRGRRRSTRPMSMTVVLNLGAPNATLLDAFTFLVMLPQHALEDIAPADLVEVGLVAHQPDRHRPIQVEQVRTRPVSSNWSRTTTTGAAARSSTSIINRYFPEAGSSVIALRAGEISFTYLSADEAQRLAGRRGLHRPAGPSLVVNCLRLRPDRSAVPGQAGPPGVHVRDRPATSSSTSSSRARRPRCRAPTCCRSTCRPSSNAYEQDVDMAKSLLADAGFDTSQPVEIVTYYADQLSQDVLVTIQQFLADAASRSSCAQPTCRAPTTRSWPIRSSGT